MTTHEHCGFTEMGEPEGQAAANEEVERLQQEIGRLRSNCASISRQAQERLAGRPTPDCRTPLGPSYPPAPSFDQHCDPLVQHLTQRLAESEAETADLRQELSQQRTSEDL